MSLELARYLVERGWIDADRMDDVLQRQILLGGSLDTNLLEAGLVDEIRLTTALAEVNGLPPATAELLSQRDPRMPKLFPARLAQKYQTVPVAMSGRSLLVLAGGRLDPLWVDEINFMLSLSVRIHLVCEARLQAFLREWLGMEIEPRFAALAERLGPFPGLEDAQGRAAPPRVEEPPPAGGESPEVLAAREALSALGGRAAQPAPVETPARVVEALESLATREAVERARREKARSGQLSLAEAAQACMQATDRDAIVDVILRFSRQYMEFVGLFVVQESGLFGWDAVGSLDARERIRRVRLPLQAPSVLRTVLQSQAAFLGPVPASGNNQELLQALGRSRPLNIVVAPVLVHGRVVALLYGDAGVRSIRSQRVSDLLVFLSRLSEAFERLILRRKGLEAGSVPAPRRATRSGMPAVGAEAAPPSREPEALRPAPVAVPAEWESAPGRTLELPVVDAPPLEVAGPGEGTTWPAEPGSLDSGQVTLEPSREGPLETESDRGGTSLDGAPPAAATSDETDFSDLNEVSAPPPAPPVSRALAAEAAPDGISPAALPAAAGSGSLPGAATPFEAPPAPGPFDIQPSPAPAPGTDLAEAVQGEDEPLVVGGGFADGQELPPAISPSALEVPAAPSAPAPREERVRVEELDAPVGSRALVTVDTEADVVVVDAEAGFSPGGEAPSSAPLAASTGRFPVVAPAVSALVLEQALAAEPGRPLAPELAAVPALELGAAEPVAAGPAPPPVPLERLQELATRLVGTDAAQAALARAELVEIGVAALPVVMPLFPGRLRFDVRGAHDRVPPLQEHGELLAFLIDLGPEACPAVADKLEAPDPIQRYYAVAYLGVVPSARAVGRLAGRLYDRDARVRLTAIEVLHGYRRTPGYDAMMRNLRSRLRADDPDQQAIAAALLGNFRDVASLPDLVMLVRSPSRMVARAAAESLAFITKQDLGQSERKWLKWWKAHKGESRVRWLIEGLRSRNRDIRFSSSQELQRLTQEFFGYYFDSDRNDRERAVRAWEQWWEEKGKHMRFDE